MCATALASPRTSPSHSAPATRSSWSGQLELGPLKLPIKAYAALVVPAAGALHSIHVGCGERVSQRKVCSKHGELTATEIGKAFEYGPNDQLTFSDEELASLSPANDETIHIEHLLPLAALESALLSGRTLYLAPLHAAAEPVYAQMVALLIRLNAWAVGRMILSDQRRAVAVRVESGRLLLVVLHWPEHRRVYAGADVDVGQVTPAELSALEKAVAPLHKSFVWEEYRDEGAERLNALIEAKVATRRSASNASNSARRKSVPAPRAGSRVRQAA